MAKVGREYEPEDVWRAENLYVVEGLSQDQVAAATGISRSQIQRWSETYSWEEAKKRFRRDLRDIRRNAQELRVRALKQAMESLSPQDIYAWDRVEARVAKMEGGGTEPEPMEPSEVIRTPAEAVTAVEEALSRKLSQLVVRPETVTLAALKDVKQCLELISQLKTRYAGAEAAEAAPAGLSEATVDEIRRRILGL